MTDIEPIIFDIFIDWLYTGNLPKNINALYNLDKDSGNRIECYSDDRVLSVMVTAYTFGDRFFAPSFQHAALDNLVMHFNNVPTPT